MAVHYKTEKKHLKMEKINQESISIHLLIQQITIECLWKIDNVRILRKQELYTENAKKLPNRVRLGKDYCTKKIIVQFL